MTLLCCDVSKKTVKTFGWKPGDMVISGDFHGDSWDNRVGILCDING